MDNNNNKSKKEAISLMEKSIKKFPSPTSYLELALMYYNLKNYRKVKKYCLKSLNICGSRSGYTLIANACFQSSMSLKGFDDCRIYKKWSEEENDNELLVYDVKYIDLIFNNF